MLNRASDNAANSSTNREEQQRIRTAVAMAILGAVIGLSDWLVGRSVSHPIRSYIAAFDGIALLCLLPVLARGHVTLGTMVGSSILSASFALHFIMSGELLQLWLMVMVPVFATVLIGWRTGLVWICITATTIALLSTTLHFEFWAPPFTGEYDRGVLREGYLVVAIMLVTLLPVVWTSYMVADSHRRERETSERLRSQQTRLAEVAKLESLSELSGGLAHDFNNLLTVIGIYGGMLPDSPAAVGIREAQQRATELTKSLLSFARRQADMAECVDVNEVIIRLKPVVRGLLPAGINVAYELVDHPACVWVSRSQLEQSVINLVTNARDAIDARGTVTISTSVDVWNGSQTDEDGDGRTIELPAGEIVEVVITDTGKGMDPDVARRAIEPFYTTKPRGGGTGLGLSTVYGMARQAEGRVLIDSQPHCGTKVLVQMRHIESSVAHRSTRAAGAGTLNGKGQMICVAEDGDLVRDVLRRSLEDSGYQVRLADNGEQAWEQWQDLSEIDLLVTDVIMPGMRGPELVDRMRQRHPRLPVIFISGYTDGNVTIGEDVRDITAFLSKPFLPSVLLETLRRILPSGVEA